jgi:hypothetical protein
MATTEIANDTACGTCTHPYGGHFISHGGTAGCMCRVGIEHPIACPCAGFMLTTSDTLRDEWRQEVGMRAYRGAIGRQKTVDRLLVENARLRGAIRTTGVLERLAQCPVCLAERTNGEQHQEDCSLVS